MSKSYGEIRDEALRRCGQKPPRTNADRIRAMSDEELANIICCQNNKSGEDCCEADCIECALDWLKQEVTTNSTT